MSPEAIDERQLRIYLDTETPGFLTFEVRIDGQPWQERRPKLTGPYTKD